MSTASNTATMLFLERSSSMEPLMFHSSALENMACMFLACSSPCGHMRRVEPPSEKLMASPLRFQFMKKLLQPSEPEA